LTAGALNLDGDTIELSVEVAAPIDPPPTSVPSPASPPPPPAPVSIPPPSVSTPPSTYTPPTAATPTGTDVIVATVTDAAGVTWTATAERGTDPTQPGAYCWMQNAVGDWHPGLTLHFYDDCLLIGTRRMSCPYDYMGCTLAVTRNGQPVPLDAPTNADGTLDFWRGCAFTVRWAACDADWTKFNPALLPDYPQLPQAPYDDSKYDYSFNGLGCASTSGMSGVGDRPDIGFLPVWDVGTVCNRDAASWAITRKAADHCGKWSQIAFVDDATGRIIDINTYPWASLLSSAQRPTSTPGPVALYGGQMRGTTLTPPTSIWSVSACPFDPNSAHLTRYAALAAMLTGSAHDRDLTSAWANYSLTDAGAQYRQQYGVIYDSQRRVSWSLAAIFMGAMLGSDQAYFQKVLDDNLARLVAFPKNPFHALTTADGYSHSADGVTDGYAGMAMWQQSYFCDVAATIAKTQPGWAPVRDEYCQWALDQVNSPYAMLATLYVYVCFLADGKTLLTDMHDVQEQTWLTAGFDADEVAQLFAATSVQDVFDIVVANGERLNKPWAGKCVNGVADFKDYLGSVTNYAAETRMVVIDAYNAGMPSADTALAYVQNLPTSMDFSRNRKFDRVPSTA
jgi:hypothetical protein